MLEKELSSGSIDKKKFAEKSKEYSDLSEIINEANSYSSYESDKKDLEKIINDKSNEQEYSTWRKYEHFRLLIIKSNKN